ncbi:hypothetical protein ACFV4E_22410 [Streptomyces hygroscopicus]|uniref:Uncharacterized protein n=1 Tax=Streptomyces hygroscopicus TaxID=1912 RepID=A0ABQ3UFM2_STRHY|nr:hypothetical protein [Streptomyces hygroscopicus]GHJ34349.1 hypothetical protein TPA0910_87820 [Streptomyces hygroscopicus]GHJ34364.1 hypothetical protein TPA0910_87970 [Streptomyces hygroscopicus]
MIQRQTVTKGVAQLLATVTGKPVGVAKVPINSATGQPYPPPYTLLYPLDHISSDGTLADRGAAAISTYQATFVSGPTPGTADSGGTVEQSEWLADKGRTGVMARPTDGSLGYANALTIPGVSCFHREAVDAGATSDQNDAIITTVIRFRFHLETAA